jgi:pimeloyl-ACP methyl ester carboxylesterase
MLFHQFYSCEGSSKAPVVIVPGLFGSTPNWRSFARKLSKVRDVYVVDQRNHGQSPKYPSNSYADMVSDLLAFIDHHGIDEFVLIGHSMGGKVAFLFAALHPERIEKLVVMDIAPTRYQHSHAPYIEALMALDLTSISSRSDADRQLKAQIPDAGIRLFLLQSLSRDEGQFVWQLNLPVLLQDMEEIRGFPDSMIDGLAYTGDSLLLYGENSDYVLPEHHAKVQAILPNVNIQAIANAGHWLHVEQSQAVLDATVQFIEN